MAAWNVFARSAPWLIVALPLLGACSLVTSWDDLPLGVPLDGEAGARDAADVDASPDGSDVDACAADTYRCGGDGVVGDPSTLYRCLGDGGASAALQCAHGCARRRPDPSDACVCVVGTRYCGNDQIVGDPAALYLCAKDYGGELVEKCPSACIVRVDRADACQ